MPCFHENCKQEEKIWLPVEYSRGAEVALHPWCIHCGTVKNISDDKPMKIGFWINILSKLSYQFSLTQCQKRLITNELKSHKEFNDIYGITGSSQKELFVMLVKKYCNICKANIDTHLC